MENIRRYSILKAFDVRSNVLTMEICLNKYTTCNLFGHCFSIHCANLKKKQAYITKLLAYCIHFYMQRWIRFNSGITSIRIKILISWVWCMFICTSNQPNGTCTTLVFVLHKRVPVDQNCVKQNFGNKCWNWHVFF